MAFNVGPSRKDIFKKLKKLTPRQRVDYVKSSGQDPATILTMLTPTQFSELFPNYFRKGLPDVSGFRDAISKKSLQKQDDINFGLSQGATDIKQAEQMGSWRRRLGGGGSTESVTSSAGGPVTLPTGSIRGKYSAAQAAALIRKAGGTKEEARILGAIAMPESSGYAWKHNDNANTGDDSYGLWQINVLGKLGPDRRRLLGLAADGSQDAKLKDPNLNAKAALMLLRGQLGGPGGYQHWSAWKNGLHTPYLGAAESGTTGDVDMPQTAKDFDTVSKASTKSGGYMGKGQECVDLSKHFSNLGPASQWKFKEGAAIVPGSIIATTSYGKGEHPGGVHHDQTPDKKSHYHTGVALTTPNSNGDVLILEQFVGKPARVAMVNIHNYRGSGERMAVVEGGEPTAKSMQAVELGKQLANPDQLPWIQSGSSGEVQQGENKPSVEVKPVQEAPTPIAKPAAVSTEQTQQYPADQQQTAGIANPQTAKVEKVDKSKKTTESYKFDVDKYWTEVKTKQPMADSMFYGKEKVMQETYKGFEEAQAAGAIKWNKKTNEIQILDPKHEKIQQIYKDMQDNNIDRNAFLTKTEAGDGGTAKVSKGKRHTAKEEYAPEITSSGLNKGTKLIDYKPSMVLSEIGLTEQQYNAMREAKAGVESSMGKYNVRGGSSKRFSGAYQLGGDEIKMAAKILGEKAPVTSVKGKKTPIASDAFLKDANMQERYHEAFVVAQHRELMKNKKYAAMTPTQRAETLAYAHNRGAHGTSEDLITGKTKADANGVLPQKYADRVRFHLAGLQNAQDMESGKTRVAANVQTTPVSKQEQTARPHPSELFVGHQKTDMAAKPYDPYTPTSSATVTPTATTKEVFDRMRQIKPEPVQRAQPETSTNTNIKPSDVPREMPQEAPKQDKNVMNMMQTPPSNSQREITIDPFLNRPPDRMPTQSLARAMQNTTDPNGAIDNRFGTNLGGMG